MVKILTNTALLSRFMIHVSVAVPGGLAPTLYILPPRNLLKTDLDVEGESAVCTSGAASLC